jgi:DNA-binding transcriptional LysR family regulator
MGLMDRISRLNMPDVDLRLLQVLWVLTRTKNVTIAAQELGVSQPALSQSLARLRSVFGDPLFTRTARSMEPTQLALSLKLPIEELLELWAERISPIRLFDPMTASDEFTVCGSDIGALILIPRIIEQARRVAPHVRLRVLPLLPHALQQQLEDGTVDLVFGGYPELYSGVHEQQLYEETYVCLARVGHPIFRQPITLDSYLEAEHVLVSARSLGHAHGAAERLVLQHVPEERIRVTSQSFLLSAMLAKRCDLVLTAPTAVGIAFDGDPDLRVFEPPLSLGGFPVKQYWHERAHKSPAHQWLRRLVAQQFTAGALIAQSSVE